MVKEVQIQICADKSHMSVFTCCITLDSDQCSLITPSTLQHSLNVPVNHVAVPQACYRFMPSACAWGCAAFVRLCE